jgi:predicted transcriptional regulator
MEDQDSTKIELTTEIVSSFVSKNNISIADLPGLINSVFTSLATLGKTAEAVDQVEKPTNSQIRKSIKPDGLVSFIDGRTYKTLKRHITGAGLTIHEYKTMYGLPNDYPTTAPAYSAMRSEMAKGFGLGNKLRADKRAASEAKAKPASKAKPATTVKAKAKAAPKAAKPAKELKGTPGKVHTPDF